MHVVCPTKTTEQNGKIVGGYGLKWKDNKGDIFLGRWFIHHLKNFLYTIHLLFL